MRALRAKITVGYLAIAVLVVGLSLFSFLELRLLEERVVAGERIGEFFDIALEIRRFEKNWFLYRQDADLAENRNFVERARALLRDHAGLFEALSDSPRIARLSDDLDRYGALMAEVGRGGTNEALSASIRHTGKAIVTVAEALARAERQALAATLDRQRRLLIASVLAVGLLVAVIVASLTRAFNHVIRQLELRQGQLVRSEKLAALGTLLSGVAHELNNPLSNISTSCEILAEEAGDGDPAFRKELVAQIDGETWRARRIVRSLLDYARDRAFKHEPVALARLVEDTLRLIRGRIPAQVAVVVDVSEGLEVQGDRQRLQQALINLLGNAIEAVAGAGEIRVAARRTREPCPEGALVFGQCAGRGEAVEIAVRDNGHGIAPDILPRIFDPFFTTKEVGRGLGLGLFIVFEIVEEHGGCIAVASEPGSGTAFLVRLPLEKP